VSISDAVWPGDENLATSSAGHLVLAVTIEGLEIVQSQSAESAAHLDHYGARVAASYLELPTRGRNSHQV
jgi:hypothetical protein